MVSTPDRIPPGHGVAWVPGAIPQRVLDQARQTPLVPTFAG